MNADEKLFYDLCKQYNLRYVIGPDGPITCQDLIDPDYDEMSKSWLIAYDREYKKLYVAQGIEKRLSLDEEPCLRYIGSMFFNIEKFKQVLEKYEKLVQSIKQEMIERKKAEIASAGIDYDIR